MKLNPIPLHILLFVLNLGRLRFTRRGGRLLVPSNVVGLKRTLDLWTGIRSSRYRIGDQEVSVETCVHPSLDLVALRIESSLIASGELEAALDFGYPELKDAAWVGDFTRTKGQATVTRHRGAGRYDFARRVDAFQYEVALAVAPGGVVRASGTGLALNSQALGVAAEVGNSFSLSERGTNVLSFVCGFSAASLPPELPSFQQTKAASAAHWESYWATGGMIDLSGSKDPRSRELERRIVLSQFLMTAMSSGSWPSSENGLMGMKDGWYLPGNGGLLYAVATMAAGWDGAAERPAPGFPEDGSWVVR